MITSVTTYTIVAMYLASLSSLYEFERQDREHISEENTCSCTVDLGLNVLSMTLWSIADYVNIYAVVYSIGLTISASLILGLTFIPKVNA